VHFIDQVVECGSQVVEGLTEQKGPFGCEGFNLADAKSILQTISVTLYRDGPSMMVNPEVEFVFEGSVMISSPPEPGYWTLETAAHGPETYAVPQDSASNDGTGSPNS
jgi:hypothetical protein